MKIYKCQSDNIMALQFSIKLQDRIFSVDYLDFIPESSAFEATDSDGQLKYCINPLKPVFALRF